MTPDKLSERFFQNKHPFKVIDEPLDVELEIPHVAYIETKRKDSQPLLFTHPISKRLGITYDMPVVMNLFAHTQHTISILGSHPDHIASQIDTLLKFKPPRTLRQKLALLPTLWKLKNVFPKRSSQRGRCQEVIYKEVDLDRLPILKTWEKDGGRFITMGQVYTQSLDGTMHNLGMYRLQQYDKKHLGMHWQIHKDASSFFDQYRKAGKKMPVTVAIGGDPLYIWCAQAPMPHGVFELLLYGHIRNHPAHLVRSLTNDIFIPEDVDIVIEGEIDPTQTRIEGPFGDHTGYYTLPEPFPVMEVKQITTRSDPVFVATVVGKPPLEDKYMGWATERIFLPLLKPMTPELIDYIMPENGVFHNLIIAKMDVRYPGHAKQFMHAFWGVGQMSFVKHAIFVGKDAPPLHHYEELARYILDRICAERLLITEGIVDHLDHSSPTQFVGGKLGIDATAQPVAKRIDVLRDASLLELAQKCCEQIVNLKQYFTDTPNPICVVSVHKQDSQLQTIQSLSKLKDHIAILIIVDHQYNDLDNPYMLIWRIVNNIDAKRDVLLKPFIAIDATNKSAVDGYNREWPEDTFCTPEVIKTLRNKKIIDVDDPFLRHFGIIPF